MIDQEIFEAFKAFFEKEKNCSNVEPEIPVNEGQVDIAAGRLIPRERKYRFDVEAHIVEVEGEEGEWKERKKKAGLVPSVKQSGEKEIHGSVQGGRPLLQ